LEFLIAFPALWVFGLCVFQLVMLARADLVVRHAADAAARSAAVVLTDDPARYGGEPEGSVSAESTPREHLSKSTPSLEQGFNASSGRGALTRALSLAGRSRRETIMAAARVPLLALGTSTLRGVGGPSLESSIGPNALPEAFVSTLHGFAVEFPDANDDRVEGVEVSVAVKLSYLCRVPLARHIVCTQSGLIGERVWHLRHSSTLLIHDAPYRYRAAREG
jgi:hypothetical protein